jgi:carboxy-cis,cis-muconate cyclase
VSPYTVFGTPYSTGCSSLAISVDDTGALQSVRANATYDSGSGVHGSDVSPDGDFFYSADDMGNGVWVHAVDETAGTVEEIQHLDADDGSDPRHLTVHPNGKWVYVVYEAASSIAVYSRDNSTGMLTFTNTTYSLLPDGKILLALIQDPALVLISLTRRTGYTNSSSYWADEVLVSSKNSTSPKYLYAATRSRTTDIPGYVSAFSLDADTGAITEQLFLLPTTNSGGSSNSVGPAGFSEEYFVIPDSGSNFLEVWKMADDATSAAAVAHLDLESGPANAVWYS